MLVRNLNRVEARQGSKIKAARRVEAWMVENWGRRAKIEAAGRYHEAECILSSVIR